MAQQTASTAGQPGETTPDEEESVTVQQAATSADVNQAETLKNMPPTRRAREAAASGFATGTGGDKATSDKYFDIAFSAANEAWSARNSEDAKGNIADVIGEVSEAAANVDPVSALSRAQGLEDPTARAIGMIAVARVVMSNSANPSQVAQQQR
jgi:hypothetical protein